MPDAQTLLIVSEPTLVGHPTPAETWRDGIDAHARLQHLAHHHVADVLGRHRRPLQRGSRRVDAELGPAQRREAAAKAAEGGARRTQDHC